MISPPGNSSARNTVRTLAALCLSALLATDINPCMAQTPAWKPTRPIEIIVGVSPGGGIDRTARALQRIMQDKRFIEVPATVINKPGGGGVIAQTYLNQHAGDAHYVYLAATSLLTNHITGKSTLSHKDITPLAMLSDEYIGLAVNADSPLKNGKDLVEALKTRPESVPVSLATAVGNTNHIAAAMVAKIAGGDVKKMRVAVFSSGGEAMTAAIGGHVSLVATPAANLVAHMQAGRLRVLAVAAPQRLSGALASVPTWREQGINAVVANWRPMIAPKNLNAAQTAFWEDAFAKLTRTPEWRSDVETGGSVNHYMNSRDLAAYFDSQYAEFKVILGDLGLAK